MKNSRILLILALLLVLAGSTLLLSERNSLTPDEAAGRQGLRALAQAGATERGQEQPGDIPVGQSIVLEPVTPVTRRMADVIIGTTSGDSMYEQWQRGEIPWEQESILGIVEYRARQEAARRNPPTIPVQTASTGPSVLAPSPGPGFDSMDYDDGGGSVPPDPEMAVGPNHVIAVVNVAVAIYDKSGTAVFGPTAAENLFSKIPCTSGLYDPNVIYDEEAQRWFLAYDQGAKTTDGGYCVLASQSSDPTAGWNEYFFPLNDSSGWLDYPHAGVGDEFIFMGGNIFTIAGSLVEGRIYAFDKSDLYSGNAVSAIMRGLGSSIDTPQPLNLHGASTGTWPTLGNQHYFLGELYDGVNYPLLRWDPTSDTLTNLGNVNLGAGGMPVDVVQNGTQQIQANDYRPLDFEYGGQGYGWTTMTISCNPGNGNTVNCVRWAQIDLSTATLGPAGSGVYGSNDTYRFFPDLAVNVCGDMAVGYTKSSSNMYPAVWISGRQAGEPAGDLQAETEMKAGEIAYDAFDNNPHRWGDYTGMTIDPDGLTFWYLGEYSKNTGNNNGRWGTYIRSFTYSSCGLNEDFILDTTPTTANICTSANAHYTNTLGAIQGFGDPVNLSTSGNPGNASFSANPITAGGESILTISGAPAGTYNFDIVGSGGGIVHTNTVSLEVQENVPGTPLLLAPADGAVDVVLQPDYSWSDTGADSYTLEVATDDAFGNIIYSANVLATSHNQSTTLEANTTYYWRVTGQNACGPGSSATASFTTGSPSLVCNAPPVAFARGIPGDWQVVDNTGGQGILWSSTAAAECTLGNLTGGSGESACADSRQAGNGAPPYDTELISNPFNLPAGSTATLNAAAYYRDADTSSNDTFLVDVWDGSGWTNELTWDEDHEPDTIGLDLSAYAGLDGVQIRFRYRGNGYDWYAQVDDVALNCVIPPTIETPPSSESLQATGQQLTQTMRIGNRGTSDLNWSLYEAHSLAPAGNEAASARAPSEDTATTSRQQAISAPLADVVADGGFETGTPNPYWGESSSNFGTPLCSTNTCGSGAAARTGSWHVWFGGIDSLDETGSVTQDVTITAGTATLSFWLRIGTGTGANGSMVVSLDGNPLFTVTEADAGNYGSYTRVQLDVSSYADGGTHTLRLESTTYAGGLLNFFVDDVALDAVANACSTPAGVNWLSATPTAGTVAPAGENLVDVTFDSAGLADGTYSATLCFDSNDPLTPVASVPVTLVVDACASTAPNPPDLTGAVQDGNDLLLSWSPDDANDGYELHTALLPYFTTGDNTQQGIYDAPVTSIMLDDLLGDGVTSYYRLLSLNCNGSLTAASGTVGEFEFALAPGTP